MNRLDIKEFIERAQRAHGNKYDYSKVIYNSIDSKVCIICPEHGEFWQTPYNHMKGQGCPKCAIKKNSDEKRDTIENFSEKLKKIHGERYIIPADFVYKNTVTKVKLICPEHGEFEITPGNLFKGQGCKKCSNLKMSKKFSLGIEKFRKRLFEKFKDDITLCEDSVYINNRTPIKLNCKKHGIFYCEPQNILKGNGCWECRNESISESKKLPIEDILERFNQAHGRFYEYDISTYKNTIEKIRIICPIHGEFWQSPKAHIRGQGCPVCKRSHLELEVENLLIQNNIRFEREYSSLWLSPLRLDFYLPDYSIGIECQGLQHFENVDFFSSNIKDIRKRDKAKKRLCERNNIKILYYTDIKKYDTFLSEKIIKDKDILLFEIKNNEK